MGMIGNSLAQGLISGANIQDGTVDTPDLKDSSITTAKVADGAVTNAKINDVAASKLTGTVGTSQIADGAVTSGKLDSGAAVANVGYTPAKSNGDSVFTAVLKTGIPSGVDLNSIDGPGIYSAECSAVPINAPSGVNRGHIVQITDAEVNDVKTQFYFDNNKTDVYTRLQWGAGQWGAWKKLFTNSGGVISGGTSSISISGTNFGYSSGYGVMKIGTANASGQTVSLYYDPVSNSSGSFNGNGVELLTIHNLSVITPNQANTSFVNPLCFSNGNAWRPKLTCFHGTGGGPVVESGAYAYLNTPWKVTTVRENQNSAWNNSTGIFSPPVAGYYYFYFNALRDMSGTLGNVDRVAIRKNSTEYAVGYSNGGATGYYSCMLSASAVMWLETSDQVTFYATAGRIHVGTETHIGGYLL